MVDDKMEGNRIIERLGKAIAVLVIFFAFVIFFALSMASCTTTKYVPQPYPVPEIHETILTDTFVQKDTTIIRDSTSVTKRDDGSELVEKWHGEWNSRDTREKGSKVVHDSIPYPVPEPYPVYVDKPFYSEKEMPILKRISMYAGYVFFAYLLIRLIRRRWKR